MDYKKIANEILDLIGGSKNVSTLEHCSTRLRFGLVDKSVVNVEKIKKIKGVMGVVDGSQFQIVIGNNVVEVYDELLKICPVTGNQVAETKKDDRKWGAKLLEFVISVFQPLVPAIAGAGVLKSVLLLLSMFGLLASDSTVYTALAAISDATFYFLPIMVAVTTANTLKSNRLVAIAAVGYLLLPATTAALADGMTLFGFAVKNITYSSQVFPAILCVIFLSLMERGFNKISPKAIRIFFVPMMSLAITIPVTLLVLGPLGYNIGTLFTAVILALYGKLGFVALGLLAAILPFMIATGMHKTLLPYAITTYGQLGYEALYMPASLAHNISESGACFAVALKSKDEDLKQTALSAGISALMGITEPALYGVTLQNKKAMMGVVLSGAISGMLMGLFVVKAFIIVGPGLASMSMFVDAANGSNFMYACIGFAVALLGSFIITFVLWKDSDSDSDVEEDASVVEELTEEEKEVNILVSPLNGEAVDLSTVSDEMFASKTLGDGIAIVPKDGKLYAPCDAEVVMLFETKHVIGLRTSNGAEILIHIGVNTVSMEGVGFTAFVKQNDKVKEGDLLIEFDLDAIKEKKLDPTVMVVNSNSTSYKVLNQSYGDVKTGDVLFDVKRG
ncbi:beta-glucoside-specific PTS transporter subunit IIABC [Holdemanella biformis]|uniref:PTS beta-glucoside transporter subunit IIBCA n=1 Tax=Holdemanella biformis TaxID=1735 RepID=A0A412IXW0_9FIRM|nr:beta-glucoside-specific PTS transporter subunit IIABC [Holdemanella biformis]RGS44927.1 PTS beta-glucoside transporter subunit IIBCA [Holdemanella biformis]